METGGIVVIVQEEQVRMELFPERDGNFCTRHSLLSSLELVSEWSSSLKGMETIAGALLTNSSQKVRMELFPERDGNFQRFVHTLLW